MKVGRRFAVFLVLLVVGQELCLARHAQLQTQLLRQRIQKRAIKHEETRLETKGRQKRSIATIALVAALSVSAASIATEVYFAINKCCGVQPQVCRDSDEFNSIKETLEPLSQAIDQKALESSNLKEDILQTNAQVQQMWNEMLRIGEYEEELVTTLSPQVTKEFNNKWFEIEQQLKAKNRTVQQWGDQEVRDQYITYFSSFETAMVGMSNFIGLGLIGVGTVAYSYYFNNQVNKMVNDLGSGKGHKQLTNAKAQKAHKVLGVSPGNVNKFVKQTAVSKVNQKFSGSGSRFTKVMNGINIVGSMISVAFDIYSIFAKFKQCADLKKQVAKALAEMKKAETEMLTTQTNVTNLYTYLQTEGWNVLTTQLTDADFKKSLGDLQTLAEGAHGSPSSVAAAGQTIKTFLDTIDQDVAADDTSEVYNSISKLNTALRSIKVLLKCYVNRGKLLRHVSGECAKGTDSLRNLYDDALNKFGTHGDECLLSQSGQPYTTFEGIEKSIQTMAASENYNFDCVLNSEDKKKEACREKADGYTKTQIASKMKLTVQQVEFFLADCPEPELTPLQQNQICMFLGMGFNAAQINQMVMPTIKVSTIQAYMDNSC